MNRSLPARTAAALVAVATLAACGRATTGRPAAAPPVGPATVAPVTTPAPDPTTPAPTAKPVAPMPPLTAGAYVWVTSHDADILYRMAPGAKSWTKFADLSVPPLSASESVTAHSPDGTRLLVEDGSDGSLWSTAADGTDRHLIVLPSKGSMVCDSGFAGGSGRIWYGVFKASAKRLTLYTARPDGTEPRVVPGATTYKSCWPALSADGSTVAFMHDYVAGLPAREYHEIQVTTGAKHRELVLGIPAKVHADAVMAVSADGSHAVVGGMHVRPDGGCGDGDDIWYLADLRTGRAVQLVAPRGAMLDGGIVFDASGRVLADAHTPVKDSQVYSVAVFDASGHYVRALPRPSGTGSAIVRIWTTVA